MRTKIIFCIAIIIFIFYYIPVYANTYIADKPHYTSTYKANTTVESDFLAADITGSSPGTVLTDVLVSWQIQSDDLLYIDVYDYNNNLVRTIDVDSTSLSEWKISYSINSRKIKLRIETSSIVAMRYFWVNSASNNDGNTTIFPDPSGVSPDPDPEPDPNPPGPDDSPVIIINLPPCEPPPVLDVNIIGVENPIPIYFPDPPPAPKAPSINPLPNPSSYIPKPNDFDLEPDMPSYNPRHYDPSKDGDIFRYDPPPLEIPEPIPSPGPLPSIPDPVIMPHDEPISKDDPKIIENPIISENPFIPEEPKEIDPVNIETPRDKTGYEPEPPRDMTGYTPEPPREITGYEREAPYTPEPPKKMQPPRQKE